MSRIGNLPINLPDKVKVNVANGRVHVEGPKGHLELSLPNDISAQVDGNIVTFARPNDERQNKALHGLTRSLVNNMVTGVSQGFVKNLEIQGVGFKAAVQGSVLNLNLGKSHAILFSIPVGVKVSVAENTKVKIEGMDRQLVGQVAANIRGYYPPEPYKGKGVRYVGEKIIRKEGKTVQ